VLNESKAHEGLDLPFEIGGTRLVESPFNNAISVAPFKGQDKAVADVLRPEIGMILPPVGRRETSDKASALWFRPGQWLVFGEQGLMQNTSKALAGMAAVADMSDAFIRVRLEGRGLTNVLSRICALDLTNVGDSGVAHTALSDIPVTLFSVESSYELLLPRSFSQSAISRIKIAMRSSLARDMIAEN